MTKNRPLVAIVDDDASVRRAVKRLVLSLGMEAVTFAGGQDFLDRLEEASCPRIGCAVLDIQMPGLGGLDVQQRLGQGNRQIPVVFITAHEDPGVRERAMAAGAVAFLQKPFDRESFDKALRQALQRSTTQEQNG